MKRYSINPFKLETVGVIAIAALSLVGCATNASRRATSGLPIEVRQAGPGAILTLRTHGTSSRFYVAGSARAHHLMPPGHVDVQLVGRNGQILDHATDDLDPSCHPRTASGRRNWEPFAVSFSQSEARRAMMIRVIYHCGEHRDS